jgi:molecular chaperone HscB
VLGHGRRIPTSGLTRPPAASHLLHLGVDPFDLLGLPPVFDLDAPALQRAYLQRSAAIHPDLAAQDAEAARQAAALNQAKRMLDDPERRANALLARLGGPGKERDRSLPPGFLIEIMETREEIESARLDPAARTRWEHWGAERRAAYAARVSGLFASAGSNPAVLRAIRTELNAWRYIERLIEQLDPDYDPSRADSQA